MEGNPLSDTQDTLSHRNLVKVVEFKYLKTILVLMKKTKITQTDKKANKLSHSYESNMILHHARVPCNVFVASHSRGSRKVNTFFTTVCCSDCFTSGRAIPFSTIAPLIA